jgi:hypothetical protein
VPTCTGGVICARAGPSSSTPRMGASGTRLIGYPTRVRFAGCTSRLARGIGREACDSTTAHRARPRPSGRGCSAVCAHVMATNRQRQAVAQPRPWGPRRRCRLAIPAGRPHGVLTRTHHGLNAIGPHRFLCFVVRLVAWAGSMAKMRKRRRSPVTRVVSATATR